MSILSTKTGSFGYHGQGINRLLQSEISLESFPGRLITPLKRLIRYSHAIFTIWLSHDIFLRIAFPNRKIFRLHLLD